MYRPYYGTYRQKQLIDMRISKQELSERIGLKDVCFDYALPQNWLNEFTDTHNLDYNLVRSTTFYVYDDFIKGYPVSGCYEVQILIDKDFQSFYQSVINHNKRINK